MKILSQAIILTLVMISNSFANVINCPTSEISFNSDSKWELTLEKKSDGSDNDRSEFDALNLYPTSSQASFNGTESILECSGTYSYSENSVVSLANKIWNTISDDRKFKAVLHTSQRCVSLDNKSFRCIE